MARKGDELINDVVQCCVFALLRPIARRLVYQPIYS
jgi:hypothetical protein